MKNIVFAAAALFAVSANANEALMELDLDKDGAISQEEAANVEGLTAETWAALDANADGKLDEAEFAMLEELQAAPVETATEEATATAAEAVEKVEDVASDAAATAVEKVEGVVEGAVEAAKSE